MYDFPLTRVIGKKITERPNAVFFTLYINTEQIHKKENWYILEGNKYPSY